MADFRTILPLAVNVFRGFSLISTGQTNFLFFFFFSTKSNSLEEGAGKRGLGCGNFPLLFLLTDLHSFR